ncbi:unnamed protein product [Diamesa hyperborea]
MFEWQMNCLKNPKVLFENANLVYSAPTSAGKTLVSEILMIKNIIERKKKSIFILPFVSVVREKMFYLQDLLQSSGVRVEGFYGGYHPAGGFESIDLAICTIEKANAIVNKLLEQEKLSDVGVIVIDEIHMISDPHRGYILELLLSKILFICEKFNLKIQLVTMSATLPNVELLRFWLKAEFFHTDFRPIELREMIKCDRNIYDNELKPIRVLNGAFERYFENDTNQIGQLCMETLIENCQLIVFCPSKEWCEALCKNLAAGIVILQDEGCDLLKKVLLENLLSQFKGLPSGMDKSLETTLPMGCAFHHAGLSTEERDLIEMGFKEGLIRILIATSTLSSGVNLPARRVIIRSPMFAGKMMSNLTYRQMIGRAGRKGKDVLGESILICDKTNFNTGKKLMTAPLDPIKSCLNADGNAHLKRAILEIIASGTASTTLEIERFVQLTLIPLASSENENDPITSCMLFLLEFEFIRLHIDETTDELKFIATRLGLACLSSSMAPKDGFLLFTELNKARQNFSLASDLHAIYLVTPYSVCYSLQQIDWMHFFDIWDKLPPQMQKVGELVGIKDSFFIKAVKSENKVDYKSLQIHKRFYTALALQDLVNERPLEAVARKFKCTRGMLQSLQQMAATFAGIVTTFCTSLNWTNLALVLGQFRERLFFGIHPNLIELMKIPTMTTTRIARTLFKAGIEKLSDLANASVLKIENILLNSVDFDSDRKLDGEKDYEVEERLKRRNFFVTGKSTGLTVQEAAKLLIEDARRHLQNEMGLKTVNWTENIVNEQEVVEKEPEIVEISKKVPPSTSKIIKRKHQTPKDVVSLNLSKSSPVEPPKKREKVMVTGSETQSYKRKLRSSNASDSFEIISKLLNEPDIEEVKQKENKSPNISVDEIACSQVEELPAKWTQYSLRATQRRLKTKAKSQDNQSLFLTSSVDAFCGSQSVNETSQNNLKIIDVLGSESLFREFKNVLSKKTEISMSIGIGKFDEPQQAIGGVLLKNGNNESNHNFVYDDTLYIDCITFSSECNKTVSILDLQTVKEAMVKEVKQFVKELLSRNDLSLNIYEAKEQLKVLIKVLNVQEVNVRINDPRMASWILNPDINLPWEQMVNKFVPKQIEILELVTKHSMVGSLGLNHTSKVKPRLRSAVESFLTQQMFHVQKEAIMETNNGHLMKVFRSLEMPIQLSLLNMELIGFPINEKKLYQKIQESTEILKKLELHIYRLAGQRFNITSTKEVAKILGLQKVAKTKLSTAKNVLEKIDSPIATHIMTFRTLSTTLSNMQPMVKIVNNNRVYGSSFSLTQTGRISMHEPNLQNVTKDFRVEFVDTRGRLVNELISFRQVFEPSDKCLLSADFCQLELRILTHLSGDKNLMKIMNAKGEDIFRQISASWNRLPENQVTDLMRNQTKQICYGIIYGMGNKALAEGLKMDEEDARSLSEEFHRTYPGIHKYSESILEKARVTGYIETMTGRRRYLPSLKSINSREKSQAERQALNSTIQGSASDLVKNAILRMERSLKKLKLEKSVQLVLHIHDELIYECSKTDLKIASTALAQSMENCVQLKVPLLVKIKSGPNWGELSQLKI